MAVWCSYPVKQCFHRPDRSNGFRNRFSSAYQVQVQHDEAEKRHDKPQQFKKMCGILQEYDARKTCWAPETKIPQIVAEAISFDKRRVNLFVKTCYNCKLGVNSPSFSFALCLKCRINVAQSGNFTSEPFKTNALLSKSFITSGTQTNKRSHEHAPSCD